MWVGAALAMLAGCSLFTDLGGLEGSGESPGEDGGASKSAVGDAGSTSGGSEAGTAAVTPEAGTPTCTPSGVVETVVASPSVVVELTTSGLGTVAWSNAANARHSDGLVAAALMNQASVSRRLVAKGYGVALDPGTRIRGVTVVLRRRADFPNEVADEGVWLVRDGAPVGTPKSVGGLWPSTMANITYGGPAETWGSSWTLADVTSAEFGVAVAARGVDASQTEAQVDHVQLTLHVERCKP